MDAVGDGERHNDRWRHHRDWREQNAVVAGDTDSGQRREHNHRECCKGAAQAAQDHKGCKQQNPVHDGDQGRCIGLARFREGVVQH